MNISHNQPFYLIKANDELVKTHEFTIETTVDSKEKKLALSIGPQIIDHMDVAGVQGILLALQHYPQYIEKMLGSLHFDFEITEGSELFIPEDDWKMKPRYLKWFHAMSALEVMPFFVKDKDVRLYMLAGDYLAGRTSEITKETSEDGRTWYKIRGGCMMQLTKRLSECCKGLLLYCHGLGFNPKDAIESMLKDYSLPVHYVDIYKQYRKDTLKYAKIYSTPGRGYRFQAA